MDASNATPPPGLEAPKLADIQMLRKIAALGFLLGALLDVGTLVLPDPDTRDHGHMVAIAVIPLTLGLILVFGRRLSDRAIKLIAVTGGIITISALVAVILPLGAALMFYCWPAMTAGYFCTRRELYANLGLLAVTCGAALAVSRSAEITGSTWGVTVTISVVVALGVSGLVRRNVALLDQLHDVATTDGLTGLLNRRTFEPVLEREVARALRAGVPLSVALFDLDHFKLVNDRFGHAAGDAALQRFGALLGSETRTTDVAARTGGEEFTVLLFGTDVEGARAWAEGVSALLIADTLDEDISLSASVGVATLGGRVTTPDELLLAADRALYAAKAAGRRQVMVAGPEHQRVLTVAA
ncbi:GGDEF domain-containing protein [Svornostia abyssi]|uniref:GGDEF domain-containing protein n=1 Tax=Svornostia abyssi TaxID=2898438 RepID=A0ABY5PJZ4_9ACTN|nr:GGDEF domain-containing protein [Parviterribacteraceae bacterium J379]